MRFVMRVFLFLMGLFGVLLSMFAQWVYMDTIKDTPYLSYEMEAEYILYHANTTALPLLLMSVFVWILLGFCIHRKIL